MLSRRKWNTFKRKAGKKINYFRGEKDLKKQATTGFEPSNRIY